MKTYKSIEETIADVRRKDKRYNFFGLIIILVMISTVASIIIYSQIKKNKENKELIAKYELESIENKKLIIELEKNKKLLNESIKSLRDKLVTLDNDRTKSTEGEDKVKAVDEDLVSIQEEINQLSNSISNNTIVRYYKRRADGDAIQNLVQSMKDPSFSLNLKSVSNDNGRYKVNTIWYGSDVNKAEVYKLIQGLKGVRVSIKNMKRFDEKSGYQWKRGAIEIGYEPVKPTKTSLTTSEVAPLRVNNNNIKYNVRFYSFNPNKRVKNKLAILIKKENYRLKLYPDWEKKPSFFANVPTVFYYNKDTKDVAEKLAATLSDQIKGVTFKVQYGNGYGITEKEKKNTFLVHYMQ